MCPPPTYAPQVSSITNCTTAARCACHLGIENTSWPFVARVRISPTRQVVLSHGRGTQVLYSTDGFVDEPHFDVPWAGDLDGDRKLDLVVNLSRKYSLHPYRLLLSSVAAAGELVGEAAAFETGD